MRKMGLGFRAPAAGRLIRVRPAWTLPSMVGLAPSGLTNLWGWLRLRTATCPPTPQPHPHPPQPLPYPSPSPTRYTVPERISAMPSPGPAISPSVFRMALRLGTLRLIALSAFAHGLLAVRVDVFGGGHSL